MTSKTCSKCKETKPVSEFNKNRSKKGGLAYECKACVSEYSRRYYEANKEEERERSRRWREDNKEVQAKRNREYKRLNKKQCIRRANRDARETNARSRELAHRHGLPWEDWEDEFVMADNGLTNYQKAVRLGRTYASVTSRPMRLKKVSSSRVDKRQLKEYNPL